MFKGWEEELSDGERLVLLALTLELLRIQRERVEYKKVMENSGLSELNFVGSVLELVNKGLVEVESPENMSCSFLSLDGKARELRVEARHEPQEVR